MLEPYFKEEPNDVIRNWIRNKDTIEFLELLQKLNYLNFKTPNSTGLKMNLAEIPLYFLIFIIIKLLYNKVSQ